MKMKSKLQRGFTLIEILVVIGIIAVLAAILFPMFAKAKESALKTTAMSNAKQLGTGLQLYLGQNDETYLPSTNYGIPEASATRMWQTALFGLIKSQGVFIAPGSEAKFAETWDDRGEMSIGYSSATAIDTAQGCSTDKEDTSGCLAFTTAASHSKMDNPATIGLLAVTPNGPTKNNYRGYEFSPYNGAPNTEHPKLSPPLVSDRDLVKESPSLAADALKPIYCRYLSTGQDEGYTPVIFADTHAKDYSAKQIQDGVGNILWRFR